MKCKILSMKILIVLDSLLNALLYLFLANYIYSYTQMQSSYLATVRLLEELWKTARTRKLRWCHLPQLKLQLHKIDSGHCAAKFELSLIKKFTVQTQRESVAAVDWQCSRFSSEDAAMREEGSELKYKFMDIDLGHSKFEMANLIRKRADNEWRVKLNYQ